MSSSGQDSDNDAPDDVSFSTGREAALHDMEVARMERNKENKGVKEWRKKREEQYKRQKESKLLSLDILKKADEELNKKRSVEKRQLDEDNQVISDGEDSDLDNNLSDIEDENVEENDESEKQKIGQKVSVAVIDVKEPRPLMQSAFDFKKTNLYGKRIKRMDMSDWRATKLKSRSRR